MLRETFRRQIADAEGIITKLRDDIEQLGNDTIVREMIDRFKERGNIVELDRRIVVTLLESIVVYDSKDLAINFRFDSGFDASAPERAVTLNGEKEQEAAG